MDLNIISTKLLSLGGPKTDKTASILNKIRTSF